MREKINDILFERYQSWATHKAYMFTRLHRRKCRNIQVQDLIVYSLVGLKKAIVKYNGNHTFHIYASIYIMGELYQGLTDLQPITILPKSIRKVKQSKEKTKYNYQYKKLLNTQFISFDNYWIFEKRQNKQPFLETNTRIEELWEKIIELDLFSKRVFQYKYDISFHSIRSNREISELMSCSEETIRMNLKKSREILQKNYSNILLN